MSEGFIKPGRLSRTYVSEMNSWYESTLHSPVRVISAEVKILQTSYLYAGYYSVVNLHQQQRSGFER